MADMIVNSEELISVANAIRSKTGTSAPLTISEMSSAISGITSGSSDSYETAYKQLCDKSATRIVVPEGIQRLGTQVFSYCEKLTEIILPKSLTYIGFNAIANNPLLTNLTIPENVTHIQGNAFQHDKGLTVVTFKRTPSYVNGSSIFLGCTQTMTINVPWSEGEVAGAPWGATNATINYNYVPEVQ